MQATLETQMNSGHGALSSTAKFFRDGKGRTRIEHGDLASVSDPVQGRSFLLNLANKIAIPGAPGPPQIPGFPPVSPAAPAVKAPEMKETAGLGEKVIEGVKAQGKRYTLPAPGRPQPVTAEIWTSHDLQLPLHSSVVDPATGTTTLTAMKNIASGAKLDPALFEIPKNFKTAPR